MSNNLPPAGPSRGNEKVSTMMPFIKEYLLPVLKAEGIVLNMADSIDRTSAMHYVYVLSSCNGRNRITNVGVAMN